MKQPAIFLDRDGTIIYDSGFLTSPSQLKLLPGATSALRKLQNAGFKLILITNQSGIGRGLIKPEELENIHYGHRGLVEILNDEAIDIQGIYFCPHHPTEAKPPYLQVCQCRKPAPGMLLQAAQEHQIDLSNSWMIGDRMRDVMSGINAGTQAIHLLADELYKASDGELVQDGFQKLTSEGATYYEARIWQDVLSIVLA